MKRTHIKTLVVAALPLFVFLTLLTLRAPKAYAALAGEDGVIIATEQNINYDTQSETVTYDSSVTAMQPDGTGGTVIAENAEGNYSVITSATVSAPEGTSVVDQTNTVVYTETVQQCYTYEEPSLNTVEKVVLDGGPATEVCTGYEGYESHQTVDIKQVTIDENGVAQNTPTLVTTIGDNEERYDVNMVINSSFAPDSENVLIVRYTYDYTDSYDATSLTRIENVNLTDGTVEEVVAPQFDYAMNGGYAQNGNIYFSKTTYDEPVDEVVDMVARPIFNSSDIWVILSGSAFSTATRITNEGNLFYIDASPDNTKLLVQKGKEGFAYVDLTSGCMTGPTYCTVTLIDSEMYPAFFSPKGTRVTGITFNYMDARTEAFVALESENYMNVAVAPAGDLASPIGIASKTVAGLNEVYSAVQLEWAPKLAAAPQVLGSSTTVAAAPTLVNTGVNTAVASLLAVVLLGTSWFTLFRKNKSTN
jgi:hypothetical protein